MEVLGGILMRCYPSTYHISIYYIVRIYLRGSDEYRESVKTDKEAAISIADSYSKKGFKVVVLRVATNTEY